MKTITLLAALILAGCNQTMGSRSDFNPDIFWGGIAMMQSSMPQYRPQQTHYQGPTNCTSRYNPVYRSYETNCY